MATIIGSIIGVLIVVACFGILAALIYGGVTKAYAETVLAKADGNAIQVPKYQSYGKFMWRLMYPVLVVAGIMLKIMAIMAVVFGASRQKTYSSNDGSVWCRNSDGTWYNSTTGEIASYGPPY